MNNRKLGITIGLFGISLCTVVLLCMGEGKSVNKEELVNPIVKSALQLNFERGDCIAIIQVVNPVRFSATGGGEGARCVVGQQSIILRQGKKEFGWEFHSGDDIFLYPYTDEKTVILLNHPDGNWIKYSEKNENFIRQELRRLNEMRPKVYP